MEVEVTPSLLEATRHEVETDMQAYAQAELAKGSTATAEWLMWGAGPSAYFNNLVGRLPGGYWRRMMEHGGFMDDRGEPDPTRSELRNRQTPREFLSAIDKAIVDEGLDINRVTELVQRIRESTTAPITLTKYVFPAFIRLRAMGYNHQDICV